MPAFTVSISMIISVVPMICSPMNYEVLLYYRTFQLHIAIDSQKGSLTYFLDNSIVQYRGF